MRPFNEDDILKILIVTIVFMLIVFNQDFGIIYYAMLIAWAFFYTFDRFIFNKSVAFPVERAPPNRLESLLVAVGGIGVMFVATTLIQTFFKGFSFTNFQSITSLFALYGASFVQATKPALQGSVILMVFNWSVCIGTIETAFCGKVLEAIWDKMKSKKFLAILMLCLFIGAGFTLFHLSAKGSEPTSLMVTFVFFSLTAGMIIWRKELSSVILMHVIWNLLSVLAAVGVLR